MGRHARSLKHFGLLLLTILGVTLAAITWNAVRPPVPPLTSSLVVNDVTQLNPIAVRNVIRPTTTSEIVTAIRESQGPISIGGALHSMGGQTATEGSLHIDMRSLDRIVNFSPAQRTITVQAGATWRQIQERIDPANLSVKIMQSFANFTVGGSLSVNAHGRYVGLGPLIQSVRSFQIVLADGSVINASPTQNTDIFYGVIGGYGGLGVITEVTLDLAEDVTVKRHHQTMHIGEYKRYFFDHVRGSPSAIFHNADIYPDDYTQVNAVTFSVTNDPTTIQDRLIDTDRSYWRERFLLWVASDWPFGNILRQQVADPIHFRGEPVTSRNYEASYDVAELEPSSRVNSTYALEEYFVPVDRFEDFVAPMREGLRRHHAKVLNISIRHSTKDPGSLLAWARTEVFAFVIYYRQERMKQRKTKSAAGLANSSTRHWELEAPTTFPINSTLLRHNSSALTLVPVSFSH